MLGYPDHLEDTADAFKRHRFNFGSIETYDAEPGAEGQRDARAPHPRSHGARAGDRQDRARQAQARRGRRALRARRARAQRSRRVPAAVDASRRRPLDRSDQRRDGQADRRRAVAPPDSAWAARRRFRSTAATIACSSGSPRSRVPSIFVLLLGSSAGTGSGFAVGRLRAHRSRSMPRGCFRITTLFARSVIALAGALLFATAALLVLIPAWNETPGARDRHAAPAQPRLDARRNRRRAAGRARRRRRA